PVDIQNLTFSRTSSFTFTVTGNGGNFNIGSITTTTGSAALTLRNDSGNNGLGRAMNTQITNNLTLNSTINLGSSDTGLAGAIYNFEVGGTTTLNSGGIISLFRVVNNIHATDGRVHLGTLNMNEGILNLTSTTS